MKHLVLTFLILENVYAQQGDFQKGLDCLKTVSSLCTDVFGENNRFIMQIAGYTASTGAEVGSHISSSIIWYLSKPTSWMC
jgi:hypothetical protein